MNITVFLDMDNAYLKIKKKTTDFFGVLHVVLCRLNGTLQVQRKCFDSTLNLAPDNGKVMWYPQIDVFR